MSIVDVDQHLYESRDLWADHIDPRLPGRRAGHRRRRPRPRLGDLAGSAHRCGRRPGPQGHRRHRRAEPAPPGRRGRVLRLRRGPARRLLGAGGPRRPPRRHGPRRGRPLPELRPALGAPAVGRPRGPDRQHGGLEPVVRHRGRRGPRPPPPRGPPDPAGPRLAARPAGRARRRGRAAGHDRPGRGRRPAALPRRPRPAVVGLRRPRGHPGASTWPTSPGSSTTPSTPTRTASSR